MMKSRLQRGSLLLSLVGLLALTGPACVIPVHPKAGVYAKKKGGPPPWAPAHGYRQKHHGHDLVFDAKIGVYVVVKLPGYYFYRDRFYRSVDGEWSVSGKIRSGWAVVTTDKLPPGLRPAKVKGPKKHRRHPAPAKHGR
jgi:hypothetical protein